MATRVPQKLGDRISAPPTDPLGVVLQGTLSPSGMAPWTQWYDTAEYVPELRWPLSVGVFSQMRTDSQLSALFKGTTLPIRRWDWHICPNGADESMVRALQKDLNLPIEGEKLLDEPLKGRSKGRFIFKEHMRLAMLAMIYGHAYFEQRGTMITEAGFPDGRWQLRKLEERPQKTIDQYLVAEDGGLISIRQNIRQMGASNLFQQAKEIPIDRLVAYVWEQEDGSWVGRSGMRDCYKNWVVKDRLIRIDAINHERAGGVPYVTAQPGATPGEIEHLHAMARDFKIGEAAGGAVPFGASLDIARAGNTDVIGSVKYHDESMARQWLLMMMQLGMTTSGSRALGRTFHDFFAQGQDSIAEWFCGVFNAHVIEDWVDWNYGPDVEQVPLLGYEADIDLALTEISGLITAGAIVVDRDMEEALRREIGLPRKASGAPDPVPAAELQQQVLDAKQQSSPGSGDSGSGQDAPGSGTKPEGGKGQ
jgi:hypothetical protein